jgi:hypothetical protein
MTAHPAGGVNSVNFQLQLHVDDVDAESTPSVVAQGAHACAPFVNGQSYGEYHVGLVSLLACKREGRNRPSHVQVPHLSNMEIQHL